MTASKILKKLSNLSEKKRKEYPDRHWTHGPIMASLFPDGVTLETPEDFNRFALIDLLVVKLNRYCGSWPKSHKDSTSDLAVYSAMLEEIDEGINNGRIPRIGTFNRRKNVKRRAHNI